MSLSRFVIAMLSVGVMALRADVVSGQDYPSKPVRILTSGAGGGTDFVARQIAQGISGPLGHSVVVDNRPTGIIAGEVVARAPADGYTLMVAANAFWIGSLLQNVPYDPMRDFSPISLTTRAPSILVVHPSLPVKSVKELITLAKARPGELNYAANALGSSPHLAGELFKAMAGVNMVAVPYKGGGPAAIALLGGEVQLIIGSTSSFVPHVKSGKLRALAVTSAQPSALVPGLPTVAASGLPGYEFVSVDGIFAPSRTPATVINRLNQEMARFLNTATVKEQFFNTGSEAIGSSPEEFAATVKSEMTRMGKLIKDVGIKTD